MEQRFTLPGLPLHRDLQAPVSIGTQFSVRATPIEHESRTLTLALVTSKNEAAIEITVHLPDKQGRHAKLVTLSRSEIAESSRQEKEIYLDTIFLLSFVHRVNPSEITKIVLDGAVICSEVVIVLASADLPPLPAYSELQPVQPAAAPLLPPYGVRPPEQQQLLQPMASYGSSYGYRARRASSEEPTQMQTHLGHCGRRRGFGMLVAALEQRGRGRRGAMRGMCRGGKRHASPAPAPSWTCFENSNY